MFTALECSNWTIFSTLITGAVFGFFIFAGGIALAIYHDNKANARRKKEIAEGRVGKLAVADSDTVYDQQIHGH